MMEHHTIVLQWSDDIGPEELQAEVSQMMNNINVMYPKSRMAMYELDALGQNNLETALPAVAKSVPWVKHEDGAEVEQN
ncbi:hypothetical protein [Lacticaseibacillus sharpeae]|uniref:Uncharacterized protein n=1 Tax=Lacticaseibacillus sharpeae JCM 1186 = DSM 20505 TaxID=1291052 RepID=A0A0R1ZQ80_9LACO|nr:hypothetical protein [Lacticaseibacillus sharpeae]KRM56661.1 hypothetical protein FC18_GL001794 [Lacticaseibacillus sharpeae JCM 1186 = DSM 20505]